MIPTYIKNLKIDKPTLNNKITKSASRIINNILIVYSLPLMILYYEYILDASAYSNVLNTPRD